MELSDRAVRQVAEGRGSKLLEALMLERTFLLKLLKALILPKMPTLASWLGNTKPELK